MQEIQNFGTDSRLRGIASQTAGETAEAQNIAVRSDPRRVSSGTRLLSALAGAQGRVPESLSMRQQKLMRALGEFIQAGGSTDSLEEPSDNGRQLRSLLTRLIGKYPEFSSALSTSLQKAGLSRTPPENVQLELAGKLAALPRDLGENSFIGQNVLSFMDEAAALQLKPEEVSSGILSIMEKCAITPEGITEPRARAELSKLLGEAARFIYENADADTSAALERPAREPLGSGYQPAGSSGTEAARQDSEARLRAALDALNGKSGSGATQKSTAGKEESAQRAVYSLSDIMRKGVSAARVELPPETENILSKIEVILKKAARIALESKLIPPPQDGAVKPEDPAQSEDIELENLRFINKLILENKGGTSESLRKAVSRVMDSAVPENADESADTLVKLADRAIRAEIMRNGGRLPSAEASAEQPEGAGKATESGAVASTPAQSGVRNTKDLSETPERPQPDSRNNSATARQESMKPASEVPEAKQVRKYPESQDTKPAEANSTKGASEKPAADSITARTASVQHREIPADDAERAAEQALRESLERSMKGTAAGNSQEQTAASGKGNAVETSERQGAADRSAGTDAVPAPEKSAGTGEPKAKDSAGRPEAQANAGDQQAKADGSARAGKAAAENGDEAPRTLFEKYQGRFTSQCGGDDAAGKGGAASGASGEAPETSDSGRLTLTARRSALSARYGITPQAGSAGTASDAEASPAVTGERAEGGRPQSGTEIGLRAALAAAAGADTRTSGTEPRGNAAAAAVAQELPAGNAAGTEPHAGETVHTAASELNGGAADPEAEATGVRDSKTKADSASAVKDSADAVKNAAASSVKEEAARAGSRAAQAGGKAATPAGETKDARPKAQEEGVREPPKSGAEQSESARKEKMSLFQKITAFFTGKRNTAEKAEARSDAARGDQAKTESADAQKVPLSVKKFIENAEINGQKPKDAMLAQSGNAFVDAARHIFNADEIGGLLHDTGSASGSLPKAVMTAAQVLNRELTAPLDSMPAVMQWISFAQNPLSSSAPQGTAFQQWAILLLTIRMRQLGTEPKIGTHCIRFRDMVQDLGISDSEAWPSRMLDTALSQADRFQQAGSVNQDNGGMPVYIPLPTPEKNARENAVSCGYTRDENGKPGFDLNFYFEIKDLGPVQIKAHVSMPDVSITAVTDTKKVYNRVSQTLGLLKNRLSDLGLRTGDFQTVSGIIRHPKDTLQETASALGSANDGSLSIEV